MSLEEAEALIGLYFKTYPLIQQYISDSHSMALLNHFVVNPFGLRKQQFGTLPCYKGTAVYNAAKRNSQNVQIQGPTSMLGLYAFAETNKAIKPLGAKLTCSVYDSIEIECPINRASEVLELAFYNMDDKPVETFDWLDLPIGVEAELGTTWGDLVVVHRGSTQQEIESVLAKLKS